MMRESITILFFIEFQEPPIILLIRCPPFLILGGGGGQIDQVLGLGFSAVCKGSVFVGHASAVAQ